MLTLRSEHLLKVYKGRAVVNDVSVQVNQGEIVGLLGPNGAGKTTSFYQIVGLIPPDSGKIFLGNQEITDLPMYKRAQLGVGYLPQEASVFRQLSVEDNIAAVLEMTTLSKAQQKERLELLLSEFGLNRVRTSMGNVLSGGERRRTEIARALATDPKFILLDEPFAGIDPIAVEDIQRIVIKLKEKNIGVLITDHNVQETLSITDRAYLLFEGKILKAGTAEELANDEQVRRVYLGQNFVLRKRVDYSTTHSSKTGGLTYESIITYTERTIHEVERLIKIAQQESSLVKNTLVNSGLEDFLKNLSEYKDLVVTFASDNNLESTKEKTRQIRTINIPSKVGLVMEYIPASHLLGAVMTFTDSSKYLNYLQETRSQLQSIENELALHLRASSN